MSTQGHESEAINVSGLKASLKKGGNIGIYNEAICSTAGGTAAKVTNTTPPSFTLTAGAKILVKFTYAISAENATLQVGSNSAKPIYYKGSALPADLVKAGTSVLLQYDGTSFNIVGDLNTDTTYSTMGASGSTHASGLVPDTPSVAGTTKFLREDGTWNVPAGSDFTNVAFLEDASEGAVTPSFDPQADTVHVTAQSLTSAQKTQARTNIDALGSSDLTGYATQTWVSSQGYLTQHQDISGLESKVEIESASGTTLAAEVGKYYRFDSAVSSLAVTLPTISNATTIQGCVFYLTTGSSISLTFTGGGTVKYHDGYEIKASSTYEINAIWNGAVWVIASIKIA